jgi:hypothetical protein
MTESFLDRLDGQLVDAEKRLFTAGADRRHRWRWRRSPRLIVAPVLLLGVAVPALAITQPWRPILGRGPGGAPLGISQTPVPGDAVSALALLRRPQDAADRGPITQQLLRGVGQEFAGVRLNSVRLVTLAPGHHAVVISAEAIGRPAAGQIDGRNPICLVWSYGGVCGPASGVQTTGIFGTAGPEVLGIVPDGVASVKLTFAARQTLTATAHDNTFYVTDAPTTSLGTMHVPANTGRIREKIHGPIVEVKVPKTSAHTVKAPAMTARFSMQWLDSSGHKIGGPRTG